MLRDKHRAVLEVESSGQGEFIPIEPRVATILTRRGRSDCVARHPGQCLRDVGSSGSEGFRFMDQSL